MTERQLKTNYFSNSHLLHLIFQAPGARGLARAGPKNLSWPSALPVDSLLRRLQVNFKSVSSVLNFTQMENKYSYINSIT